MTEIEQPDRQPEQAEPPECGSRWGTSSDFQFAVTDFEDQVDNPVTGNNDVWGPDKYETVFDIESLWAPVPDEENVGTWSNPFGVDRQFNTFTRQSRTTYNVESGCEDNVEPVCGEGTLLRPPDPDTGTAAHQSQPFIVEWDVQSTSRITCDLGDEQVDEITGVRFDGTPITKPFLYKRRLQVDISKQESGSGEGTGLNDFLEMPTTCSCR
jgi:hypothetical protein